MIALVSHSLGRVKGLLAAITIVLVGLQLSIIAAASSFADTGDFERLSRAVPAFVLHFIGPALGSFRGMVLFAYVDPLVLMLLVQFAIYVATQPAGEVESSYVDLILARPLPRHSIVSRSLLVVIVSTLVISGAMFAATWAGLWWLAPAGAEWPAPLTTFSMNAHMTLIAWCFGCIALAASGWARRRSTALGAIAVTSVVAYLVELLEAIWKPATYLARFSPFHYFPETRIMAGTADTPQDLAVLGTIILAAVIVAYWRFEQRDL